MIISKKGQKMLSTVSQIYFNNRTMLAIFQAIGNEIELSEELTSDVSKQLFIQTATWGLDYWEKAVGIVTNKEDTLSNRKSRILTKMQTRYPITQNRMKMILETATNQAVKIIQNVSDYTFQVNFDLVNNFNVKKAIETLDEIKPAHLAYNISLNLKQKKSDIYIASTFISGEEITVYPYSITEIGVRSKVHVAVGHNTSTEEISVYPREEE